MSSSNPHKPHSGSVHDPNSEYSIEYVQKQVPMSPNIIPAVPMASLRNVSGLNIEVKIAMDQTTSALMIANISFTEIPCNLTNTQLQAYEVPRSTPQSSTKANPHSNSSYDFLLNPGGNLVEF
ncbi:hypothetical protein O181_045319 [Austropuccinia psidii MF-1]|uniref:Uncharacterized protein n=1 Tax=Austropuccinia psidii MF-1 TaxID=1389203 RepID=A0A9Q3DM01_9BASI|nr:hypothetical protein [Austropuccinia psidii MF-1]